MSRPARFIVKPNMGQCCRDHAWRITSFTVFRAASTSPSGATCDYLPSYIVLSIHGRSAKEHQTSSYRVHLRLADGKGPSLGYWCMVPGVAMKTLQALGVRSILLTSGTLSPLDSFAHELVSWRLYEHRLSHPASNAQCVQQISFPIRLENPHVVMPSQARFIYASHERNGTASVISDSVCARQIWAGVMPVGPSGGKLNSSFHVRDTDAYKLELGTAILRVARVVPDGLLVFFPSYSVMSNCLDAWKCCGSPLVWYGVSCATSTSVSYSRAAGSSYSV